MYSRFGPFNPYLPSPLPYSPIAPIVPLNPVAGFSPYGGPPGPSFGVPESYVLHNHTYLPIQVESDGGPPFTLPPRCPPTPVWTPLGGGMRLGIYSLGTWCFVDVSGGSLRCSSGSTSRGSHSCHFPMASVSVHLKPNGHVHIRF